MNPATVIPVTTRAQRRQFLYYPWELYRGDPNWAPPLLMNQKELLGYKKHPFHERAEMQTFLALRDGKVCGRIAAIVNHAHNERHKEQRGFFGFFECDNDQQVASALFATAGSWLKERGMQAMRGPANPSLNYECGLLVDGFDTPPFFMTTYNRPYLGGLVEGAGLQKSQDMFSFWGHVDMLKTLDEKLAWVNREATERFHIALRSLNTKRFGDDVRLFLDIYNKSLPGTWGFVPLSESEVAHMASGLKALIIPDLAIIAEAHEKPIGAVFGLLDYNPRVKRINGRLFPFGFIRLLLNRRKLKNMRVIAANVLPEYQGWGVGLVVLAGLIPKILEWGIQEVEFSWVLESNHLSRKSLERGGAKRAKTWRMYDRDL